MNARSLWLSVLIAGALIAVLGNVPFVNLVNCLLCIWVWVGGSLAVYLYRRFQGGQTAPTPPQGAGLGALSGLVGAVLGFFVFLITGPLLTSIFESLARSFQVQGMPFQPGTQGGNTAAAFGFLLVDAVLYPIFGALGGLITASLMKERTPQA